MNAACSDGTTSTDFDLTYTHRVAASPVTGLRDQAKHIAALRQPASTAPLWSLQIAVVSHLVGR